MGQAEIIHNLRDDFGRRTRESAGTAVDYAIVTVGDVEDIVRAGLHNAQLIGYKEEHARNEAVFRICLWQAVAEDEVPHVSPRTWDTFDGIAATIRGAPDGVMGGRDRELEEPARRAAFAYTGAMKEYGWLSEEEVLLFGRADEGLIEAALAGGEGSTFSLEVEIRKAGDRLPVEGLTQI